MRELKIGGGDLVSRGRFNFGTFDRAFRRVNPLEADVWVGVPIPRALKAFRLKEWQAFQFGNGRFFINVALFNAKTLALVQVKLYDRERRRKLLFERKVVPWAFSLPENLLDSKTSYRGGGCRVSFRNLLRDDRIEIALDIAAAGDTPAIVGSVTAFADRCTPMVVAIPFGDNHGMYSHKGLMQLQGRLRIDGQEVLFDRAKSYLLMDDHKGYYPLEMVWDWATAAGFADDGRLVGFNLTRNQSTDQHSYNENGLWVDGRLHLLPPVSFSRTGAGSAERWQIRDAEGRVELEFSVEVDGRVDINALVMRSKYRGPFGVYSGSIVDSDGVRHPIDRMFGMAEDFYLRC